jgi:hypothetical protein
MIYIDLQKQFQADFAKITFFAFSKEQFEERYNTPYFKGKKLIKIGGGGFIRKKDRWRYEALFQRYERDITNLSESQLFDAIVRELSNTEYCYSRDLTPIRAKLCLNETHNHILNSAVKEYLNSTDF